MLPEVDVTHARIGQNFLDRSFDQHTSLMEHCHRPGDPADKLHVMFDHDQGMCLREL